MQKLNICHKLNGLLTNTMVSVEAESSEEAVSLVVSILNDVNEDFAIFKSEEGVVFSIRICDILGINFYCVE